MFNSGASRRSSVRPPPRWSPCCTDRSSTSPWQHLGKERSFWLWHTGLHIRNQSTVEFLKADIITVANKSYRLFPRWDVRPECAAILLVTVLLSRSHSRRSPDFPPHSTEFPSQQKHLETTTQTLLSPLGRPQAAYMADTWWWRIATWRINSAILKSGVLVYSTFDKRSRISSYFFAFITSQKHQHAHSLDIFLLFSHMGSPWYFTLPRVKYQREQEKFSKTVSGATDEFSQTAFWEISMKTSRVQSTSREQLLRGDSSVISPLLLPCFHRWDHHSCLDIDNLHAGVGSDAEDVSTVWGRTTGSLLQSESWFPRGFRV